MAQQVREATGIWQVEDRIDAASGDPHSTRITVRPDCSKDDGEICRRDRLALAGGRTGHEECPHGGIKGGESDIRAQRPIGLRKTRARVEEASELVELLSPATARHPGDGAQGAETGHLLDSIRVSDAIIQLFRNERHADDHEHSQSRGEQRVERIRGDTGEVGGAAGSSTVSRFVALPDENDSNVVYVDRRLASLPSTACSSVSCSAVGFATAIRASARACVRSMSACVAARSSSIDSECRLAALNTRRRIDQLGGKTIGIAAARAGSGPGPRGPGGAVPRGIHLTGSRARRATAAGELLHGLENRPCFSDDGIRRRQAPQPT